MLNQHLGLGIDIGRGLVQDQDIRLRGQRPGKSQQLSLARRKGGSAFGHRMRVPVLQVADEAIGAYAPSSLLDLLSRNPRLAQADIALHVSGEEEDILLHHADMPPEFLDVPLADVDAVDQNRAALDLVEAADQIDDRTLARAGGAHQGDGLPGLGSERDVLQDPVLFMVGEKDVAELDFAPHPLAAPFAARRFGFAVEQFEDALG